MFRFPFLFDQRQGFCLAREEIGYGVICLTSMPRLGKMVVATENHFQRDVLLRPSQRVGHRISQVHQESVEQPGGSDLHLDA